MNTEMEATDEHGLTRIKWTTDEHEPRMNTDYDEPRINTDEHGLRRSHGSTRRFYSARRRAL